MPVKIKFRKEEFEVKHGMTVRHALEKIEILPDTVLITRDGELLTDDEILQDGDEVRLIAVISGG